MEIQKQKDLYLAKLLEQEVIKQDEFEDLVFKAEINAFHSNYLSSRFMDNINFGWSAWQAAKVESHKQAALYQFEINHLAQANQQWREKAAKAQAAPEGFVLVPKEPTDIEIESIKEKHWDMRGCQLCKSDYIDLYKAMIGACDEP